MPDTADRTLARWLRFGGFVLVVAVLYWAQTVLVPLALATLITFVLTPPVAALQRWIGRVPAVLAVAVLVFTVLGLAGWGVAAQMSHLAADLPHYRANIRQKIADVRGASRHGSVEQVQQTVDAIKQQIEQPDAPRGTAHAPVIVQSQRVSSLTDFPAWVGPALGPLSTAGFVITLVIFMLLEREELRARLLGLVGHGNLAVTTKAFDEAGRRVSRQLLMQTLVNTVYAMAVGLGLWSIGVPYPLLWAALGGALRFIPYLGPIAAAAGPILVSLAALPGWHKPLEVVGLFVGLELFTNLVLETVLYAGAAGVSQVALLVAVAAWTWLWGAMGLLLATPLTVCLVVLGKHVPGLEFLSTLIADSPPLAPDAVLYQRLLARDQSEAADIVEQYVAREPAEQIYDALLVPALCYAERDRLEDRLSDDEERQVIEAARELLAEDSIAEMAYAGGPDEDRSVFAAAAPVDVFGFAVNGGSDTLALEMLARLVRRDGIRVEVPGARLLTAEIIDRVRERGARILCLADLPPSPPSKARYLVRRLRAALPDAIILVGRWAPPELTEDDRPLLIDAGANSVASTLLETRDQLRQLAATERQRAGSLANAS